MSESRDTPLYSPYASYAEMQDAYLQLSEEFDQAGDRIPEDRRPQFEEFIGRAVATGVILESASERRSAQGLIDYFTGQLGSSSGASEGLRSQPLRRYDPDQGPELPEYACPYAGLASYCSEDAERFFGREELARQVVSELKRFRIVLLLGVAGCGKTSLVQAGVLPLLREDAIPGSRGWRYLTLTPGASPEWPKELSLGDRASLSEVPSASAEGTAPPVTLLFIDQLEELFQLASPSSRRSYMDAIMRSLARPDVRIILALRREFEGQLTEGGLLPSASMSGQPLPSVISVGPLQVAELRAVIEKPAARVGLLFEPGLVDRLVGEFLGDPTGLPLLQMTLSTLWQKRHKNRIPRAAYEELGGGRELLARHATQVVEGLPAGEGRIARRMLLRLLRPHEGSAVEAMRVMARVRDILATEPEESKDVTQAVLGKLIAEGLMHQIGVAEAASEDHLVELAHESLARHWMLLNRWVAEVQIPLRQRRRWEALYSEWVRAGMGDSGLLDAGQAKELETWLAAPEAKDIGFDRGLQRYLFRSKEVFVANERKLQRAQRIAMSAALALGVVVIFGVLALYYRVRARELDLAEERGRQLLNDPSMRHEAALWLDYALRRHSASQTLRPLLADALRPLHANQAVLVDPVQGGRGLAIPEVSDAAYSPDGQLLATAAHDGMVRLWDVKSGRLIRRMAGHTREVTSVSFSPDGRTLVSAGVDGTARIRLTDSGNAPVLLSHVAALHSAEYSPDGTRIVAAAADQLALIWDAATGQLITSLRGHSDEVMAASFSPNGHLIATAGKDKWVLLWDARSQQLIAKLGPHAGQVWSVAFSPGGEALVASGMDGTAQVWDIPSGHKGVALRGETGAIYGAVYSPDGTRIVTGSDDNTVRLWDAHGGQELSVFSGHSRAVASVSYRRDGGQILSSSSDGTTRLWSVELGQPLLVLTQPGAELASARYSPDETLIVATELEKDVPSPDGNSLHLWEARSGRPLAGLLGHRQTVRAVAFSPDGSRLLTGSADHTARIFALEKGGLAAASPPQVLAHPDEVTDVAFSPDGQRVVTACADKQARVYSASDGKLLLSLRHETALTSVQYSPDGRRILSTTQDDVAFVWDAAAGSQVAQLAGHTSSVVAAAYSPDGTWIATASVDRSARIWDARSGALVQQLRGHAGPVLSVSFSRDSATLVTGSGDRTARLWGVPKGRPSLTLRGHSDAVHSARFSSDGTRVLTASKDGSLRVWDIRPEPRTAAQVSGLLACRLALRLDSDLNILPSPLTGQEAGCEPQPVSQEAPRFQDRDRELKLVLYALRAGQTNVAQHFLPAARAGLARFPDPLLQAQLIWAEAALSGDPAMPAPEAASAEISRLPKSQQTSAWEALSAVGLEYLFRPRWSLYALEQARAPERLAGLTGQEQRRILANRIEVLLAAGEPAQALREGAEAFSEQSEIGDRVVLAGLLWLAAVQANDVTAQRRWSEDTLRYYGFVASGTSLSRSFFGLQQLLEQGPESEVRQKGLALLQLLSMSRSDTTLQELAKLVLREVPTDALRLKK